MFCTGGVSDLCIASNCIVKFLLYLEGIQITHSPKLKPGFVHVIRFLFFGIRHRCTFSLSWPYYNMTLIIDFQMSKVYFMPGTRLGLAPVVASFAVQGTGHIHCRSQTQIGQKCHKQNQ